MVKEGELQLLEEFAYGELEKQDFLTQYPVNLLEKKGYLLNLIVVYTEEKDSDNLELLLDATAMLEIYEDVDFQSKYRELLKEDWHKMHESLIDSLDKTLSNEDSFIYMLDCVLSYYSDGVDDFMVPIWNKCLWSLYEIKSEKGMAVIRQFVDSDYESLHNTAKKIISKLNDE